MPDGYDSHADYMGWVKADADARAVEVRDTLIRAFAKFVEVREIEVINFSAMTALDLAAAIQAEPNILKPLMACCNVAGRAIERDLDIRGLDTYVPRLSEVQSAAITLHPRAACSPSHADRRAPAMTHPTPTAT